MNRRCGLCSKLSNKELYTFEIWDDKGRLRLEQGVCKPCAKMIRRAAKRAGVLI